MDWFDAVPQLENGKLAKIGATIRNMREHGISVLPETDLVLNAFTTPFDDVKVVIVGQDPYPTAGHAMGLAFSVPSTVKPLPKSLINIFQELKDDLGIERTNGDLTDWANQGVLLLNTSLTVEQGKPGSHNNIGWQEITTQAIRTIDKHRENVVFILWGNHAIKKAQLIDEEKHYIIVSPHPSPLAAHRGFFGSKPFSRTNNYLISKNITPINW